VVRSRSYFPIAMVTAAIGNVATAGVQPTYRLAAICREDWVGWIRPGHGNRDVLSGTAFYDLSTSSSNAVFVIGRGAQRRQSAIGAPALELISCADPVIATLSSRRLGVRRAARNSRGVKLASDRHSAGVGAHG
jgi:hypothetical protein